jgi:WD40 repeat protein
MAEIRKRTLFLIGVLLGGVAAPPCAAAQGQPDIVWTGQAKSGYLWAVAFSPDGQIVATGDGRDPLYDPCTGELLFPGEGTVRLWNALDGTLLQSRTEDQASVLSLAISPDSLRLASGAVLKLWDLPDLASFQVLSGGARSLAFSPDGQLLAAGMGGDSNAVKVFTADGAFLRNLPFSSWVTVVTFSPDSRLLAVGNATAIQIYRTFDWQFERVIFPQHGVNGVSALAFSRDGETLASSGRTTKLWHISDGELVREFDGAGPIAFSPDGQVLLTTGQQISFWNVSDGSLLRMYDRGALILSVAFSPDNTVFAYAPLPGNVVVARNPLAGP